jgi:hypothetical protein
MLNDTKYKAFVVSCINDQDLANKWTTYRHSGNATANDVAYFPAADSARLLSLVRGRMRQLALQPNPADPDLVILDGYIRTMTDERLHRMCVELESVRACIQISTIPGNIAM